MERDFQTFKVAFHKAETRSRESFHNWARTVITIMTPSLVLLIGLQDKTQLLTKISRYLLVTSITLMALTILIGLLFLYSETKGQHLLRDSIANQWNTEGSLEQAGIELPKIYLFAQKSFFFLTPLSIISLTIFGICKYIT